MSFIQIAREGDGLRFASLYRVSAFGKTWFTLIAPEPQKSWFECVHDFDSEEDAYEAFGERVRELEAA